jgi:chemotaxis protein MotB
MARRRREEEHENHERWLVSYADFITLLFAFFVVMYAVSSVNEGKYKVLSNSLTNAFSNTNPITSGQPVVLQGSPPIPPRPIVAG